MTSSRPSVASVRIASSKASPPTGSTTTSTPRPSVASRTALAQPSVSGMTASGPNDGDEIQCALPVHDGDHPGAHRLGDLDRRNAHATGRSQHQHRLAGSQRGAALVGEEHGVVVDQQRNRFCVIEFDRAAAERRSPARPPARRSRRACWRPKPDRRPRTPNRPVPQPPRPRLPCPAMNGGGTFSWYSPLVSSRSGKHTPAARTSMSTIAPRPGRQRRGRPCRTSPTDPKAPVLHRLSSRVSAD